MRLRRLFCPLSLALLALLSSLCTGILSAQLRSGEEFVCGTTEAGLGPLPGATWLPSPRPAPRTPAGGGAPTAPTCMTREHIFLFEDTDGILGREHTGAELLNLKVAAANAVIARYGDNFDFFGYWTNFDPVTRFGGAHFGKIRNDVLGIGYPIFDNHASLGLDGWRAQGMAMMYDFHIQYRSAAPNALAHEFAHRWVLALKPMPDGRIWGGGHFKCMADQQGGAMGAEWHGTDPAHDRGGWKNFDTGGRYSYLVLYLMGYVTAEEMDAGMSEQRYMDGIDPSAPDYPCLHPYRGRISFWDSSDITATNGPRIPAADNPAAQHDFTVAWVLFYEPGEVLRKSDVGKLVHLTESFHIDWAGHTIGRGTLNGQLFPDLNCNGIPDADE